MGPWDWSWTAVAGIATALAAIFTAYMARHTARLARITAVEVNSRWRPMILPGGSGNEGASADYGAGDLVVPVVNGGVGPALEVWGRLRTFDVNAEDLDDPNLLPNQERWLVFRGVKWNGGPLDVRVEYTDISGKPFITRFYVVDRGADTSPRYAVTKVRFDDRPV